MNVQPWRFLPQTKIKRPIMRILMVDDELDFLDLMQKRLGKRNIEVVAVPNGLEALKVAETADFDVVLLDVKMPGIDGLETLRRMKAIKPDLPVLLLTGHASMDAALAGVETGAADYLMKPVTLNDLIFRIMEVTGQKL